MCRKKKERKNIYEFGDPKPTKGSIYILSSVGEREAEVGRCITYIQTY